jgi:hypothetical protein
VVLNQIINKNLLPQEPVLAFRRRVQDQALDGSEDATPPKKKRFGLFACRGEGSAVGLQLRVRFVLAALLAVLRTASWLSGVFLKPETGQVM